ncbi:hypothetical protein [Saccharopolyspora griseoalba]|uniref:Uncharacterized protein n=1 Tax=Saccharopolyspora griseoalba TaxID=1431848 RepID=A0ABW2LR33_9PSEU
MSRVEQLMREVAHALATEDEPAPELAAAAVELAAEALRVATDALPEHTAPATAAVVMPVPPQDVLICAERTAPVLLQVMQLLLKIEPQLYALPDDLLHAKPTRSEESGAARGSTLKRQAATALRSIGGELTSGVSPWLLAKVSDLRHVEVRKEQ